MSLAVQDYKVAWVCPLPLKMAAAKAMLDEIHSPLHHQSPNDHNTYTLGRRSDHNVAVACLPSGVYGAISAATVLSHMLSTFPNLRLNLMVGIGGGVFRENVDIRLGDVVVSMPNTTSGGVVQYDYGKNLHDGSFQPTGSLNKPPQFLLTALSQMRSNHIVGHIPISGVISRTLERYPDMKNQFARPEKDWLFKPDYDHQSSKPDCSLTPTDEPYVHYGLIASGNQVMKNGMRRDSIALQMDILCFEMEAAGLVDQLPCLVIRGICDYCVTHKHKQWQGYAALATAVYASHLLMTVPTYTKADQKRKQDTEHRWMVPLQRTLKFVGREKEITRMEDIINGPCTKVAICGLESHSMSVFWIPCTSYEVVEQAFASICNEVKSRVKCYLEQDAARPWLLIFGNADDMNMWFRNGSAVQRPYPFTTRNRKLALYLSSSHVIQISEPDTKAAVQILEKSAATYINKNAIAFSGYIELLQEQEADAIELLSEDFGDGGRYKDIHNPVATTWLISFRQIRQPDQLAAIMNAIGLLKAFSFISEHACYFSLHRLVHLSTRNWLRNQGQFGRQVSITTMRFAAVFPDYDDANRKLWRKYLPHVISLFGERDFSQENHEELIRKVGKRLRTDGRYNEALPFFEAVLRIRKATHGDTDNRALSCMADMAWTYRGQGRWVEAEKLERRHPEALTSMGNLAGAYSKLGKWEEAEVLGEQVLEARKRSHGPEHPRTLRSMGNLAWTYSKRHKYEEAKDLEVYMLETSMQVLGVDNPNTLNMIDSLAYTYGSLENSQEAEELAGQAMEGRRRILGPEHPYTLKRMKTLAQILRAQGKMNQALPLMQTCFELRNRLLGPEHPSTKSAAQSLENMKKGAMQIHISRY
ncbi:hypothetical protein BJY01DRAFT_232276 [Aspergillus pseudoustus]|uniref:Nucleoside phosphorylase domain-containing protein n=1 Tax=Aspergillus pseudoustus TaxID=1810923 RepID=A0ABR4KM57_9EURO